MTEYDPTLAEADVEETTGFKPLPIPPGARRLTKQEITAAVDVQELEIYVPEWPTEQGGAGTLLVRGLDRTQFHAARKRSLIKTRGGGQDVDLEAMEANIMVEGIVDPKYTPFEIKSLMKKNMGALQQVLDAINFLSGTNKEERARAATAFRNG